MNEPLPTTVMPSRAARLRALLASPQLEFLMEAHNGLSARIVEEAGFKGIWASGLALSAQFGVRDNNEASWTQIVDMLEFMTDAASIPILLDGDTGYGNFNNLRRLVRKLEQRGVAGVCIEDKLFPKTNSFIDGERQPLADIEEFCGKIKAGKDSQCDPDFCVVARVEALIAGWDLDEALRRAHAYVEAGADAILIHSKLSRPDQILAFARDWGNRAPVVIVPTKYYSTPTEVYRKAGISTVIWANHLIRAAVQAMQTVARNIHDEQAIVNVEDRIAPVNEIFRLQGADELQDAERRYIAPARAGAQAIVLAASRGSELAGLTDHRPKVMLPIGGKPLLRRLVDEFKIHAVNEITVVAGYKAESIDVPGVSIIVNRAYEATGELASLACAEAGFSDSMVVLYGDLLFRGYILRDLLDRREDVVVVVDSASATRKTGTPDYAYCTRPDDRAVLDADVLLEQVCDDPAWRGRAPNGRWVGMLRVQGAGRAAVSAALAELRGRGGFDRMGVPDLLNHLVGAGVPVGVLYVNGHWLDVNSLDDIERASLFAAGG
ncbi:MAG: phosphoenolpyruvate mutase [Gammaproteobacteria bacterium]